MVLIKIKNACLYGGGYIGNQANFNETEGPKTGDA
jgi:hypothetical protein